MQIKNRTGRFCKAVGFLRVSVVKSSRPLRTFFANSAVKSFFVHRNAAGVAFVTKQLGPSVFP